MASKKNPTPSANNNISIGGDVVNSTLIIGNNNIVFSGEYVSLKEHYIPPDSVFQRVRTEDFVGRDWLTVQVDAFLNDPQRKSGTFLLIGDAGVGKTSFMAHLVKERGYLHLFAEQAPGQAMLQRAIQSLGSQLVTRYQIDPYKDRDTLIQGTVFPDFLERLLRMAASKLTGGKKIVIVCDALDEAGTFPDGNVFGLPNVLPDGVYLILSQRPVNVKLPNLEPLTVRLEAQGADNLGDMEKYLRVVAQRASVADQLRAKNYSDAFFIQTLKEKSLGVWMYLHYVIKEIEQGSRAPLELEALPTGLVGYYADFWGDWRMGRKGRGEGEKAWNALYAPLLTTLAAAQEAITIGTLIQWAGVDADEDEVARLVAEEWRAFIEEKEASAETRYKPYHLSFADFIAGRADGEKLPSEQKYLVRDLAKRTVKAHQRIVKVFEAECNGQWEKLVEREYQRLHLSAHLNGAGEYETLRILLTEGEEKIKWAEAREKKEEIYAGYLNDLSYVWAYAERKQNYALAIRCMLIENSLHSLASNIPPELLIELAKAGLWSYAQCLSIIRQKLDSDDIAGSFELIVFDLPPLLFQEALTVAREIEYEFTRARALSALAPHLNDELITQAFVITRKIEDEHWRARALSALAPHLNDELITQAFVITREIEDENCRAHALSALAPHLNDELITQAFVITREIEDESARAHTLVALVPHLNTELKTQALQEALVAAREIKDEHWRASVLAALAPYLNDELITQALSIARDIEDEFTRANALAALAPHLNDELITRALSIAREIEDEHWRARTLSTLAPHLNDELKTQVLQEALSAARGIEYESDRAHVLADRAHVLAVIALHLNDELKTQVLQEALSAAREIKWESASNLDAPTAGFKDGYVRLLVALAPHLNNELKTQVLQEALSVAREIKDEGNRVHALATLVPRLNDEFKTQALVMTSKIIDEDVRADALATLAPYLSSELKTQALVIAREITWETSHARALTNLVPHLKNDLKIQVLKEALAAARETKDEWWRVHALAGLAPHLKNDLKIQVLQEALAITREITWVSSARARLLTALLPHYNDELKVQVLQEFFSALRETKEEQWDAKGFTVLLPHLNDELKTEVLQEALVAAREIKDERRRVHALANLAPHLKGELKRDALQESLVAASKIEDESARAHALVTLAPYLSDEFKTLALSAARKIKDKDSCVIVLSALAPYLTNELKTQVLTAAREIKNNQDRASALTALAPYYNDEIRIAILQELLHLSESLYISGYDSLCEVLNAWRKIEFKGLREHIISFSKFISQRERKNGVEVIGILTPALMHFSGEEIVPELYRAIQDTARWWP